MLDANARRPELHARPITATTNLATPAVTRPPTTATAVE